MKPISAYMDPNTKVYEKFAWLPKKSSSGKTIWFSKYVVVQKFFDDAPRAPLRNLTWDRVYTPKEYTLLLLQGDSYKVNGQEFTGAP